TQSLVRAVLAVSRPTLQSINLISYQEVSSGIHVPHRLQSSPVTIVATRGIQQMGLVRVCIGEGFVHSHNLVPLLHITPQLEFGSCRLGFHYDSHACDNPLYHFVNTGHIGGEVCSVTVTQKPERVTN